MFTPTSKSWPYSFKTPSPKSNWNFNLGLRGDLYNGISIARQAEPRVGVAYNIKKTNTVLRVSYAAYHGNAVQREPDPGEQRMQRSRDQRHHVVDRQSLRQHHAAEPRHPQ